MSKKRRRDPKRAPEKVTDDKRTWRGLLGKGIIPALVFTVTFSCFLPALTNEFVNWDDQNNFVNNSRYRGLSLSNLKWMFTTFLLGPYQPLSWLTLGIDYIFWGLNPTGYHLTNMLLHSTNAVLFYGLILALLTSALPVTARPANAWISRIAAASGALFFAIHPLRVESVAWASERRDVLSGLFFFLALLAYFRLQEKKRAMATGQGGWHYPLFSLLSRFFQRLPG